MGSPLHDLIQYRDLIRLDELYRAETDGLFSEEKLDKTMELLLETLIREAGISITNKISDDPADKRRAIRSLLNVRLPAAPDKRLIYYIDTLLQHELAQKRIVNAQDISPVFECFPNNHLKHSKNIFLWKGDITCLKADAIVNAANDRLLGCFQPLHDCIDNVIHSASGPLLREDCKTIMDIQGRREKTGDAKITRGYNLPSRYVIHTVGPIITGNEVTRLQDEQLASCYVSSLSLAAQITEIKTIAFPCISTGVFNFPRKPAAKTAVQAVDQWLDNNEHNFTGIIFNVFLEEDLNIYERIFRG